MQDQLLNISADLASCSAVFFVLDVSHCKSDYNYPTFVLLRINLLVCASDLSRNRPFWIRELDTKLIRFVAS
jgi:hypothetical protein